MKIKTFAQLLINMVRKFNHVSKILDPIRYKKNKQIAFILIVGVR